MYEWSRCYDCRGRVLLVRTVNDRRMPLSKPPDGILPNVRLDVDGPGFLASVVAPGTDGAEWVHHRAVCAKPRVRRHSRSVRSAA